MKLHNINEDIIMKFVDDFFLEEERNEKRKFCTCNQCRLDLACYVLNRIPPQYIVSGRGFVHIESENQQDIQKSVDLIRVINDGLNKIAETKRPYHGKGASGLQDEPEGPLFNLPTITGRIFNGKTFEPIKNIRIALYIQNTLVKMMDENWSNPFFIAQNTSGNYIFWPYPVKAEKTDEKRVFSFSLSVNDDDYEELRHFFDIEIVSSKSVIDTLKLNISRKIEDLYLFPK